MVANNTYDALYGALTKALAEIKNPIKKESNPFFKSKYATLDDTLEIATKTLAKYDLGILQLNVTSEENNPVLKTRIIHSSGAYIEDGGVPIRCKDKNNPQQIGSAITYARRYGLQAMLGMVGVEDDDANTASKEPTLSDKLKSANSLEELENVWADYSGRINKLTPAQQSTLTNKYKAKQKELENEDI
tara:strand:+ start:1098 stop:1664 length:567 start_codon:yes stop_codon:yes gene_type:complete